MRSAVPRGSAPMRAAPVGTPVEEKPWVLTLPNETNGEVINRREIYSSQKHGDMDPIVFSSAIPQDLPEHLLSDLTIQVLRQAPTRMIPNILGYLACSYSREIIQRRNKDTNKFEEVAAIDVSLLRRVVSSEGKSVCGCVFKKGDLVWNCRNCAKDPTCVQCDPCFRKSNHKGHEVYFHRAGGDSGCCDCGDPEAWSKQGNCTDHQPKNADHDPSESFPTDLKRAFRAVVQGILTMTAEFAIISTRGMEPITDNKNMIFRAMRTALPTENVVVRVHNDDCHTFDQVIRAFRSCGKEQIEANKLTDKVDKEGCAVLLTTLPTDSELTRYYDNLKNKANLIVSIVPEDILLLEEKLLTGLKWTLAMGNMSEGFRRLVSQEMLTEIGSTSVHSIPLLNKGPYHQWILSNAFANQEDAASNFPSEITQVSSIEELPMNLSMPCSVSAIDPSGEESNPIIIEEEFKERIRHPFNYCHRNVWGVLSMASPFLTLPLKKWIHDVIMRFQHDRLFKNGFSQIITTLYPSLSILYCRHFGVSDDSIFRTTVQLYTAHSIVELMSTTGIADRVFPEGKQRHITIATALANTLYGILVDLGKSELSINEPYSVTRKKENTFLNHHSIRTNRVSVICRDFEYLTGNSFFCTRMLLNEINPGTIESWIDVCRLLQEIDQYQRLTTNHVEFEDDVWQYAANLALEIETVSTHLVASTFLDPSLSSIDNEFHVGSSEPTSEGNSMKVEGTNQTQHYSFEELQVLRKTALERVVKKTVAAVVDFYSSRNLLTQEIDTSHDIEGGITLTRLPFQVSKDPVSCHLPLHRLYLKSFMYAAYGNISCEDALAYIRSLSNSSKRLLFDWPLRCLAWNSQVNVCKMWVRNGTAVANLLYNYSRPPLSRQLRDMDLLAVQIALLTNSSVDRVLLMVADRFEVLQLIDNLQEFGEDQLNEYRPQLLSEFLRTLIHVFTCLPFALLDGTTNTKKQTVEGIDRVLKREVFHQVLAGHQSLSALSNLKASIGQSNRTISDQMILNAVNELCQIRTDTGSNASAGAMGEETPNNKLVLLEKSYRYFDPEFINMSTKNAVPSTDRVRDYLKSLGTTTNNWNAGSVYDSNPYIPLVSLEALPIPHRDFALVRELLVKSQRFVEILHRCMQISWNNSISASTERSRRVASFNRSIIMGRVIHLVTLQIHCHTLNPEAFALDSIYSIENPSGWGLLQNLCMVWQKETFKDDFIYHQGLGFILHHFSQHVRSLDSMLHRYGFSNVSGLGSAEDEKKRRRKEAQAKALEEAKKRAAEAMKMFGAEMSDDEDDEDGDEAKSSGKSAVDNGKEGDENAMDVQDSNESMAASAKKLKSTMPICIVCREKDKENDALGFLCFAQTSNAGKNILLSQTEMVNPVSKVYRVVALDGCDVLCEPNDSGSSSASGSVVVGFIPFNESVIVDERKGNWMKISVPYDGWIKLHRSRKTNQPAPGINSTAKRAGFVLNVLHPVKDCLFNKNGGTRVHISTCGHAMHFGCWDLVYATNYSRVLNGERSLMDHSIDIKKGECLCPLCKSVSNAILPIEDLKLNKNSLLGFEQDSDNEESDFPTEATPNALSLSEVMTSYGEINSIHTWLKQSLRKYRVKKRIRLHDEKFHAEILSMQSALCVVEEGDRERGSTGGERSKEIKSMSGVTIRDMDKWFHGNMKALRSFFSTSSAIAYSLMNSTTRNLKNFALSTDQSSTSMTSSSSMTESWNLPESEKILNKQLLGLVSRMSSMFSKDLGIYHRMLVSPILSLLVGKDYMLSPSTSGKSPTNTTIAEIERKNPNLTSQWRHLLRTVPFQAVHSVDFPDLPTVIEIMKVARTTFEAPENGNVLEELFSSELWGFAHSPLLTQDLTIFAIVTYGLMEDEAAYKTSLFIILIAKVCQLLLEPEATGLQEQACNISRDPSDTQEKIKRPKLSQESPEMIQELSVLGQHLRQLQQRLCRDANTPLLHVHQDLAHSIEEDCELVLYVCDSLIPFLEYICRLYDLLEFNSSLDMNEVNMARQTLIQQNKDDRVLVGSVGHLLRGLHFPDLLSIVDSPLINYLGQVWANDLKLYYPKRPSDQEVKWIPQNSTSHTDVAVSSLTGVEQGQEGGEDDHAEYQDAMEESIHHYHDAVEGEATDFGEEDEEMPELLDESGSENDDDDESDDGHDHEDEQSQEGLLEDLINNPPQNVRALMDRVRAMLDRGNQGGNGGVDTDEINPLLHQLFQTLGPNFVQTLLTQPAEPPTTAGHAIAQPIAPSGATSRRDVAVDWKQYGVLPLNGAVDELKYQEYKNLSTVLKHFHTPLQGSLTGSYPIYALNGELLPYVFPDLSHRTLSYRQLLPNCLIPLPNLYTDLYNHVKFPEGQDGIVIDDPVVCLVCGQVLSAGRRVASGGESARNPGECTVHAERCGAGIGVFFLLHQCQVLLIRGGRAIYHPSVYLDESGETVQSGYYPNKPMYLSQKRYRKLEEFYMGHQVGKEVARKRISADSVIREFWH